MTFLRKLTLAGLAMGLVGVFFGTALAQNPQPTQPQPTQPTTDNPAGNQQRGGFGRGEGRRGPGPGMMPGLANPRIQQQLNLSDDQKQQLQTIFRQSMESTKAQREQMGQLAQKRSQGTLSADDEAQGKTLHEHMRASMKATEAKAEGVLTPDQKTQYDQLRKQHEGGGFNRRGGFQNRPNNPPTTPPSQP
jgi:Spy/CpxP family protein refolding chaperone